VNCELLVEQGLSDTEINSFNISGFGLSLPFRTTQDDNMTSPEMMRMVSVFSFISGRYSI
jgi:hypothetical protein